MFKEQELMLAQQVARLAIWEWSADAGELRWLPGSTELFGYPLERLRTLDDVQRCIVQEDRDKVSQLRQDALRTCGEYNAEYRIVWPNGEIRWIRARGCGVEHAQRGKSLLGVSQDITEEKRREEKLRAQARLLDLAYEPIIVRDNSDRISYWNNGAQRLYGYTQQEAKGQVAHELLQTKFPQSLDDTQRQLHAAGFWQGEVIQTTKDGRLVHVESRWQTFSSDGKLLTLESDFDLSYQQAAQLARAWEEKAKLIADMSHEINNPLTVALSATHLLKSRCDDPEKYIGMLEEAILRIAEFIRKSGEIHRGLDKAQQQRTVD